MGTQEGRGLTDGPTETPPNPDQEHAKLREIVERQEQKHSGIAEFKSGLET